MLDIVEELKQMWQKYVFPMLTLRDMRSRTGTWDTEISHARASNVSLPFVAPWIKPCKKIPIFIFR